MAAVTRAEHLLSNPAPAHVVAEDLGLRLAGQTVFEGLSFTIGPGLTLVRGGDGRGKTSLLCLLAGTLTPTSGRLRGVPDSVFHEQPGDPAHDAVVARAWLAAIASRHPRWDAASARGAADAFALQEHIDKPLFMLSTGSRRKLGLVAAAACGARLTLLDTPYAALDAASRRALDSLLGHAAVRGDRAWVVADHAIPVGLTGARWAGRIELDD